MKQHPDHRSDTDADAHVHEHMHEREHEGAAAHEHDPTELGPSDPYPFIYSRDPIDERRFAPPGAPYEPAFNGVSRGATVFSIVVICCLVGLGVLVIVLALVGR